MPLHYAYVLRIADYLQQILVADKIKSSEFNSLALKVITQSLLHLSK